VGILSRGRLLLGGSLEDLKQRFRRITSPIALDATAMAGMAPVQERQHRLGWEAIVSRFDESVFQPLRTGGPGDVEAHGLSLEELFIAVAGAEGEVRG
jgi:hypothetical protein